MAGEELAAEELGREGGPPGSSVKRRTGVAREPGPSTPMVPATNRALDAPPDRATAVGMRRELCDWFAEHRRDLPWRRTSDPYAVWISEAMLQQTRVETVIPYWERFLAELPTIADLAAADEERLLALWSGLGYYRRARSLRLAAREIRERHDGRFPDLREDALALPGIGPYTAGAVLSIAYDLPEPVVDGNVMRVLGRLFDLRDPWGSPALARRCWALAGELMRLGRVARSGRSHGPGAWNQALMELGATVCTARNPRCGDCPLAHRCVAFAENRTADLPVPGAKRPAIEVELELLLIVDRGRLLLERRPEGGRMAGMWELPTRELRADGREGAEPRLHPRDFAVRAAGARLSPGEVLAAIRHSITCHRIRATVRPAEVRRSGSARLAEPWRRVPLAELESTALTGLTAKAIRHRAVREFLGGADDR